MSRARRSRSRVAASISRARARVRSLARATSTTYPIAIEATQTSSTLWKVSRLGSPRWMMLAAATKVEAKAAHRQPPLIAKARTAPAVQIEGSVGPSKVWEWTSAIGVSMIPVSATTRSAPRKRLVQLAAERTLGRVASVHTARNAR